MLVLCKMLLTLAEVGAATTALLSEISFSIAIVTAVAKRMQFKLKRLY